jgi:UDP-2,3-diacylglucosamine hydrolase
MAGKFCLVAGSGELVTQILQSANRRGLALEVFAITGRTDLVAKSVTQFAPADLDTIFDAMREHGFTDVLLAGYVSRETWLALQDYLEFPSEVAAGTAELARRLEALLPGRTGARLVGIHEVAPELIAPDGAIAGPELTQADRQNARSALMMARELGWKDVGQAVVVSPQGKCEAEDARGTDALLSRVAAQRTDVADTDRGWILAKALKPHQPLTMDVPVIGPATIENARRAGISVIAVEAGGAVIVERKLVEEAAAAAHISVVGLALERAGV